MNRKKRIILELGILIILSFLYIRSSSLYLSGEKLLYANEIGLHYGPSKEVLVERRNGRNVLMIGLVDNRELSVIQGKKLGPFYRLRGGGITGQFHIFEGYSATSALLSDDDCLFGIVDREMHPDCTRVVCFFERKSNDTEGEEVHLEAQVQENGFFYREDLGIPELDSDEWYNTMNVEGYDAKGQLIFKNY